MLTHELKKQTRAIDLSLSAGRRRQSPRTGFVHLFPGDETALDVIPLYENFCFAFTLFRQRTAESVNDGKELIQKLLPFQLPDGNFPVFMHDYPRCYDSMMCLKVAPILIYLLRLFPLVLGELAQTIELALKNALQVRPQNPIWENRFRACVGEPLLPVDTSSFSASNWLQWLITAQLAGITHFSIPYNEALQVFLGPTQYDLQEKGELQPHPIEWILAEGIYSSRLSKDHPHQLLCAPLFPISVSGSKELVSLTIDQTYRLLWSGKTLHSLVFFKGIKFSENEIIFDLPEGAEIDRNDLFEAAAFCDISSETELLVDGRKATVFNLGDTVTIRTPQLTINLKFELILGSGDFCGRIYRANRPNQISCKGAYLHEAFDWKIGMRTLRRSGPCQIRVSIQRAFAL